MTARKPQFFFTLRLASVVLLFLSTVVDAEYICTTNNGEVTITGYGGFGGAITIPTTIGGFPVVKIADNAFLNETALTSVSIPSSVTDIGRTAFSGCKSMTAITMTDNVTNIGYAAFSYCEKLISFTVPNGVATLRQQTFQLCTRLEGVSIPEGVTTIEALVFVNCSALSSVHIPSSVTSIGATPCRCNSGSLTAITVDPLNTSYSSSNGVLFNKSQTTLIECPSGKAGHYEVPDGVTRIGTYAFAGCRLLTNIILPESLTAINNNGFINCSGLRNINIPDSLTTLGGGSFYRCSNMTSYIIPENITSIGFLTFAYSDNLEGVYFRGDAPSFAGLTFENTSNVRVYYLPGTTNWGATADGRPTELWTPRLLCDETPASQTNGFVFSVEWARDMMIVIEASTNLLEGPWIPLSTNTMTSDQFRFCDVQRDQFPQRFYCVRSP